MTEQRPGTTVRVGQDLEYPEAVVTDTLDFSLAEATEIRLLLGQRLGADRDEQKRLRGRLRAVGFRISDFEVGLTPAGFDALVARGVVSIRDVRPPGPMAAQATSSPSTSAARGSAQPARTLDVTAAQRALAATPWTLEEATARCPSSPGLYAL